MKAIEIQLTPEEAQNCVELINLALRHKKGGVRVMPAAMAILNKIQAAVQEAQNENRPDVAALPAADK